MSKFQKKSPGQLQWDVSQRWVGTGPNSAADKINAKEHLCCMSTLAGGAAYEAQGAREILLKIINFLRMRKSGQRLVAGSGVLDCGWHLLDCPAAASIERDTVQMTWG